MHVFYSRENESNELIDLILHEKPLKILIGLKQANNKTYPSMLSKFADCTYSHAVKILQVFEKFGIVEFERVGRIKYVSLTDEGEQLAFIIEELYRKMRKMHPKKRK